VYRRFNLLGDLESQPEMFGLFARHNALKRLRRIGR
jgi:hypothetical protein